MYILRIEHPVPNYGSWKKAFDADPVKRKKSGVRCYTVSRPIGDEKYVLVDLEFETSVQAEAMLTALRQLWERVGGSVMTDPVARILEVVEKN